MGVVEWSESYSSSEVVERRLEYRNAFVWNGYCTDGWKGGEQLRE